MKNRKNVLMIRQFGIIAVIAIIGFAIGILSFTGCKNGTTFVRNSGGSGGDSGGDKEPKDTRELVISDQQVWEQAGGSTYEEHTGDLTIIGPSYATGSVVNGILSFTLGAPVLEDLAVSLRSSLWNVTKILTYSDDHPDYTITVPVGVKGAVFENLITNDEDWVEIRKRRTGGGDEDIAYGALMYVYVSGDVTVTGRGGTGLPTTDGPPEHAPTYTTVLSDFSLSLKAGWNPVKMIQTYVNTGDNSYNVVETVSLGDHPDLIWALWFNRNY